MAQSILSGILSFISEGVVLFSPEGKITSLNPYASLLIDETMEEVVGKPVDSVFTFRRITPPTSLGKIVDTVFARGETFTLPPHTTVFLTSHSGRTFPVFIAARKITLPEGDTGILVFRDISDEKTLEDYKENTATRLSSLTRILQHTATGDFSVVPDIPQEEDEFTELSVGIKLMVEDLREMEKERAQEQEKRIAAIQKAEADRRHLAEHYARKLEGQVAGQTREITRAKMHVEAIIENLADGLLEYDQEFTLLRINRAAEYILGMRRADVVGKKILPKDVTTQNWQGLVDVSYPALAPSARKIVKKDVTPQDNDITEIKITYPAERELQVITVSVVDRVTGERYGFIKLLRDITREKNIARSKSEFISIAAHQLRTPLSAIKWVLHMVINGDTGPLTPSQKELLTNGYDTNEKMIHLVNDLLNVARIEEGRFGYTFAQGDLLKTIESVMASIKGFAMSKKVTVHVVARQPPAPFTFDASKITLVLQNLIDNAVKYTPEGGTVTVEVEGGPETAVVHVRDTGIGIPQKQMNRLFTKFFRADNALHMQTSGSGLGLYLAKNIIERHGGTLTVSSIEGKGTTFTMTLPTDARRIPQEDIIPEGV